MNVLSVQLKCSSDGLSQGAFGITKQRKYLWSQQNIRDFLPASTVRFPNPELELYLVSCLCFYCHDKRYDQQQAWGGSFHVIGHSSSLRELRAESQAETWGRNLSRGHGCVSHRLLDLLSSTTQDHYPGVVPSEVGWALECKPLIKEMSNWIIHRLI